MLKTTKETKKKHNYNKLFLTLSSALLLSPYATADNKTTSDSEDVIIVTSSNNTGSAPKHFVETESTAGTKSSTPLIKTPQTISVINRNQMEEQGVTTVADSLNYSSGVITNYRGSSNRHDEVITRGFRYAPKFLDGLSYSTGTTGQIDPWLLDRVELVHGPASVLYGQTSPGGLINMTSKKPTVQPIHTIQMKGGSQSLGSFAFDFGGALSDDNAVLYRLNGILSTKKQFVKGNKNERIAIAPALTWTPNNTTTFTLLTSYQNDPKAGYRNFYPRYGTVTPVKGAGYMPYNMNLSDPSFDSSRREQMSVGYIFEHDINDIFSFQQNLRYSKSDDRSQYMLYFADEGEKLPVITRFAQRERNEAQGIGIDSQLKAFFSTGNLEHNMIAGLDYKWVDSHIHWKRDKKGNYDLNWSNPVRGVNVNESALLSFINDKKELHQLGVYLQDQLSWENWNLTLSGRYDWTETTQQDLLNKSLQTQKDNAFTGRAGLLYAFDNGISPYISYSTSFEPNLDRGDPAKPKFKPTTGEQTEIGIKFQPQNHNTMLTLSLFDITQENITTKKPDDEYKEQIGKIGSKGAEVEINAQITPEIELIASYTYTDAKIKSDKIASRVNRKVAAIPEHMASVWGSYSFNQTALKGFTLGAGVRYMGSAPGDFAEKFYVRAYTLYDLMAKYDLGEATSQLKGASVKLNVSNLTDKHYVASCSRDFSCFFGSGRSIAATVEYNW
ncbi:TonB-dependent siderophore receptor [Xenorhabdus sp. 12]|uniref:TonB-dependent siderophore receptor n=2 Tax=Xenorhabdus santafensis TaxID=2582833 RepID=A0ABU4SCF9_9GAMM|nr:TonB-dependent siderophore receptor [Xenorhabdus sp. 12]